MRDTEYDADELHASQVPVTAYSGTREHRPPARGVQKISQCVGTPLRDLVAGIGQGPTVNFTSTLSSPGWMSTTGGHVDEGEPVAESEDLGTRYDGGLVVDGRRYSAC